MHQIQIHNKRLLNDNVNDERYEHYNENAHTVLKTWRLRSNSTADFKIIGDQPRRHYCRISIRSSGILPKVAHQPGMPYYGKNPPRWQTVGCIWLCSSHQIEAGSSKFRPDACNRFDFKITADGPTRHFLKTTKRHHHICKTTTEH